MDFKNLIIDALDVMRKKEVAEKQTFKARAYQKVIIQLKDYPNPITSYEDVRGIEGIGEKISDKIWEIIKTGSLKSAEKAKQLYNISAFDALQNIYGVGPTKAKQLIDSGYTTIEQLRKAVENNSDILNDNQRVGLKYYEDLLERIPREEMYEHRDILETLLPETDQKDDNEPENYGITIDIVGSFRRGAESSGDIDVLIRVPENLKPSKAATIFKEYIILLQKFGYLTDILAQGEKKCMGVCKVFNGKARRLDLLLTPAKEYPYALLYFTGSDKFNVAFRQHAIERGYKLNEHFLSKTNPNVKDVPNINSEKSIFTFLGLRYIEPKDRIDHRQIITLKRPTLPKQI
jgi:DNA polymerase beta